MIPPVAVATALLTMLASMVPVLADATTATTTTTTTTTTTAADTTRLAAMIRTLTAPELAGRGAGTPEERAAAEVIASWFAQAGLVPAFAGSWLQEFALPGTDGGGVSVNVGGVLAGQGALAERWIVLGAHLDHLGRVDPDAKGVPQPGAYYPGAGDNAAGVAVIVDVARSLAGAVAADTGAGSGAAAARRSLLICAFGAEEIGLVGSAHLAAKPPVPREAIDAMVNLDAVGRLGDGPLHVAGLESSAAFADLVAAAVGDVPVAVQGVGLANSDHVSFLAHAIPALFLFTGAYPEMNSPADSLAAIDLRGLVRVAGVTARLVAELAAHDGPLPFIANETAKIAPAVVAGDRRTWFGSVPDFAAVDSEGYRIGGLAADGPAARAGLRVGDRLLSLAGEPVSDLASFTTALRRHAPGEVVDVKIEREGRTFTFLVTLGDRADRLQ